MGLGGPQDPSRVLRGRGSSFSLGFASRFSDLFRAIWRRFSCLAATSVLETVALAAGLEDVAAMRQPVECRARESLAAEHLGPILERQVGRHDQTRSLVSGADDVEQQLSTQLAGRNVPQLVQD